MKKPNINRDLIESAIAVIPGYLREMLTGDQSDAFKEATAKGADLNSMADLLSNE